MAKINTLKIFYHVVLSTLHRNWWEQYWKEKFRHLLIVEGQILYYKHSMQNPIKDTGLNIALQEINLRTNKIVSIYCCNAENYLAVFNKK